MVKAYGSKERPVSLDHYRNIVEVGWATGGVVVAELEFCSGVQGLRFNILSPPDPFGELPDYNFGYTEIFPEDYHNDPNWYARQVGDPFVIQDHIITQDEITDNWIWDAFLINELGNDTGVDGGNRAYGPFDLHFEGMQVAYDTTTFGRPVLGDYVNHTHPNGHSVVYAHGATPISQGYIGWHSPTGGGDFFGVAIRPSDPNGIGTLVDFSSTESWYWYHTGHIPAQETAKIRQAWLIYFASDRTHSAEVANNYFSSIPEIMKYNLRGYPDGTAFDIKDGHITPKPPAPGGIAVLPMWEVTEEVPSSVVGQLKRFGPKGVTV